MFTTVDRALVVWALAELQLGCDWDWEGGGGAVLGAEWIGDEGWAVAAVAIIQQGRYKIKYE